MSATVRLIVGTVVFIGLIALGRLLLGLEPTWQEVVLIAAALGFAEGVEEGLR